LALACLGKTWIGCRYEPTFFVTPSEARGPSTLTRLGRTWWGLSPRAPFLSPRAKRGVSPFSLSLSQEGDFSLRSKRQGDAGMPRNRTAGQGKAVTPSPLFCRPERSEGSLGAYTPREDMVGAFAPSPLFFCLPEA
jgi:hypothetical protein